MQQQVEFTPVPKSLIDPETFRRVWDRVMPDQRNSPLVVDVPQRPSAPSPYRQPPARVPQPPQRPIPALMEPPTSPPATPKSPYEEDAKQLELLLEQLPRGLALTNATLCRGGQRGQGLSCLLRDHKQALRQLGATYFLLTGKRYPLKAGAPVARVVFSMALREQFFWEQQFAKVCEAVAQQLHDTVAQTLCRQLVQNGGIHTALIRAILERL